MLCNRYIIYIPVYIYIKALVVKINYGLSNSICFLLHILS